MQRRRSTVLSAVRLPASRRALLRPLSGALAAAALLVLPLSGCAPEPGTVSPDGTDLTEKQEPEGGSWAADNPDEAYAKSAELPDGFPAGFVVPEGAVIDDAGSRGEDTWFVVLSAPSGAPADAIWEAVIAGGDFVVSDEAETGDGGRAATLTSTGLWVDAVTLSGEAGTTLLSYDISSAAG